MGGRAAGCCKGSYVSGSWVFGLSVKAVSCQVSKVSGQLGVRQLGVRAAECQGSKVSRAAGF